MELNTEDIIVDLKLFIDVSNTISKDGPLFESFYEKLIAITYDKLDIAIDFSRQRIQLLIGEQEFKDCYLNRAGELIPYALPVNIFYKDLAAFLKKCLNDNLAVFEKNYDILKSEFIECCNNYKEFKELKCA